MSNNLISHFSTSYPEARKKFINSANNVGAVLHSIRHPEKGMDGEDLYMDFAVLGPDDAENAMLVISGTHGIEGYCGSFVQNTLLNSPEKLAALSSTKLILLHGHNPYGFSWLRRTNENNVDLNRNYCDFDDLTDVNNAYLYVKDIVLPKHYDENAEAKMQAWIKSNGVKKYQQVVMSGQRVDPKGIFYGAMEAQWSRNTVFEVLPTLLNKQKNVCVMDIHTGLGPFGHGDLIHAYPKDSNEYNVLRQWYGEQIIAVNAGEYSDVAAAVPRGPIVSSFDMILPNHQTYAYVIEYGTVDFDRVIKAIRMDGWLHNYGKLDSEQGKAIKQEMRDSFYSEDPQWLADIWKKAIWSIEQFTNNNI